MNKKDHIKGQSRPNSKIKRGQSLPYSSSSRDKPERFEDSSKTDQEYGLSLPVDSVGYERSKDRKDRPRNASDSNQSRSKLQRKQPEPDQSGSYDLPIETRKHNIEPTETDRATRINTVVSKDRPLKRNIKGSTIGSSDK